MIGIVGGAGYTGGELIRLLLGHPEVGVSDLAVVSTSHAGQPVGAAHPDLAGTTTLRFTNELSADPDVVFLCSGHGQAKRYLSENPLPDSTIVIDLSQDFRLDDAWTYGLPELHRERIRTAKRVANPGCFATTIELALLPLAGEGLLHDGVTVTAITGSTGAGQAPSDTTHFSWRANNLSVYKAFDHQHLPEIHRTLAAAGNDTDVIFIPMRGPFQRGIMASCLIRCERSIDDVTTLYRDRYEGHPFVVVADDLPDLKRITGTNRCCVGLQRQGDHLLVVSVLDNLLKGASGQAVQNMNLTRGYDETAGLDLRAIAY